MREEEEVARFFWAVETRPPMRLPQPGLGLGCSVVVVGGAERAEAMLSEVPLLVGGGGGVVSPSKSGRLVMVGVVFSHGFMR